MENSNPEFNIRNGYLSPESAELAMKELRETPEVREAAIEKLRDLLRNSPDLYFKDDDAFLLIWLRVCHFYPQSALEKMKSAAAFRLENAALLRGLVIDTVKEKFIKGKVINVLKNTDQKGRRVLIVNCGAIWDPGYISSDEVFQMLYLINLAAQLEEETQVNGTVCIMDFDGMGMKQVKALTVNFSRRLITFIQEAMPLRMKEVHYVKQPFVFKMVWALFKPFVNEKLNKRLHFHGSDMKSLHKFLSPEILPENYGGKLPKIDYSGAEWISAVEKHEDFIKEWSEMGPSKW